ncbi:3,4-dihydroxy-2-butanone-4-phosphate synthase [Nocardia beijingensis]|uniref:3,4-dihydroxy-2-butanone-4-phosphate synthase n=1 Tax=Nocardia beijingensis TaxID=95162 RepID=UPI0033E139C0
MNDNREGDEALVRVQHAWQCLADGGSVVVTDDDRDVGYLVMDASAATTGSTAFLVRHSSGIICVGLAAEDCDRLGLVGMSGVGGDHGGVDFTVSVDAAHDVSTGISAHDRAVTIRTLGSAGATASSLTRPGHVLPVRVHRRKVIGRAAIAEAVVSLMHTAGLGSAGAFAAVVSPTDPSSLAGVVESAEFADLHGLARLSIDDVVSACRDAGSFVHRTFGFVDGELGPALVGFHSSATDSHYLVTGTMGRADTVTGTPVRSTPERAAVPLRVDASSNGSRRWSMIQHFGGPVPAAAGWRADVTEIAALLGVDAQNSAAAPVVIGGALTALLPDGASEPRRHRPVWCRHDGRA